MELLEALSVIEDLKGRIPQLSEGQGSYPYPLDAQSESLGALLCEFFLHCHVEERGEIKKRLSGLEFASFFLSCAESLNNRISSPDDEMLCRYALICLALVGEDLDPRDIDLIGNDTYRIATAKGIRNVEFLFEEASGFASDEMQLTMSMTHISAECGRWSLDRMNISFNFYGTAEIR